MDQSNNFDFSVEDKQTGVKFNYRVSIVSDILKGIVPGNIQTILESYMECAAEELAKKLEVELTKHVQNVIQQQNTATHTHGSLSISGSYPTYPILTTGTNIPPGVWAQAYPAVSVSGWAPVYNPPIPLSEEEIENQNYEKELNELQKYEEEIIEEEIKESNKTIIDAKARVKGWLKKQW